MVPSIIEAFKSCWKVSAMCNGVIAKSKIATTTSNVMYTILVWQQGRNWILKFDLIRIQWKGQDMCKTRYQINQKYSAEFIKGRYKLRKYIAVKISNKITLFWLHFEYELLYLVHTHNIFYHPSICALSCRRLCMTLKNLNIKI